jgi:pilus assembly protein CpaE
MTSPDKIRVLIVDDISETRESIRRMLQFEPSIEVIGVAENGKQAIEMAQQAKPDVVIMDINMPDIDGITATEQIRKKVSYIQVVILSVQSDPSYMRRAMLAGARDFLAKPPMIDELVAAVKRAGAMAVEEKSKAAATFPTVAVIQSMLGGGLPASSEKWWLLTVPKAAPVQPPWPPIWQSPFSRKIIKSF